MQSFIILSAAFSTFLWVLDTDMRHNVGSWQRAPMFNVLR